MKMASERTFFNLVLLGKTGHGKSTTGNTILRSNRFKSTMSTTSETKICQLECSKQGETLIRVVDTPGVMDTCSPQESTFSEIGQAMSLCLEGFSAIIFVLKFGAKLTKEEQKSVVLLKEYFGINILREFGIIVMTSGDSFELCKVGNMTFKAWLDEQKMTDSSSSFVHLVNECNSRCILFFNKGECFERQRQEGLQELFDVIRTEIPKPYTSKHFQDAKAVREALIKKLRAPALCAEIQENLSLLMEELNIDIENNTVPYDSMTQKFIAIEEKVMNLNDDSKESKLFKIQINDQKKNLELILKMENDKNKQKQLQDQMLKDLEILKNPPSRLALYAKYFCYGITKCITFIGNKITFHKLENFIQYINDHVENMMETALMKKQCHAEAELRINELEHENNK